MEKITLVGTIAVAVILVIIFIYIGVKFFNLFPKSGGKDENPNPTTMTPTPTEEPSKEVGTVIVPNILGYSLDEAEAALKESGLTNYNYTEEYNDTFKKGTVCDQYPKKNAEISADAEVQFIVSSGPESFKLPNVYNSSEKKATDDLENAGLVVERDYAFSDEVDEGRVIETNPKRDTMVVKGDTVTIIISNGPENTQSVVPSLINLTQAEALKKLEDAGLTLGIVSNDYSDAYKAGTVMYQNYEKGTKLDKGTAVDITINLGAKPTQKPNKQQYVGQITITDNPFDYSGDSGIIEIEMEQDGKLSTLYKGEKSYDDFPITLSNVKSNSGSDGTVHMYVGRDVEPGTPGAVSENGRLVKYEEYDTIWAIYFTPVEG